MTLEFAQVVGQVQRMGGYLSHRASTTADRLQIALDWLEAASDLDAVHDRIAYVRGNIAGYRGAAPAPRPHDEIVPGTASVDLPPPYALIAADGSQIYPDPHGSALYYLINVGLFSMAPGEGRLPRQATLPVLAYTDERLQDREGRLISTPTVNTRRTIAEVDALAAQAWALRGLMRDGQEPDAPIIALHDGGLLKFFSPTEIADAGALSREYFELLLKLRDSQATLAGYVDRTRSSNVISLLYLLSLAEDQITEAAVKTNGVLEGVTDADLFGAWLQPGERSAIFTQNSPQNADYQRRDPGFEIAFFYINVGETRPHIARVEIPLWVAADKRAVADLQAVLIAQCAIQGRERYPYALTRADELAYIKAGEKQQLEELIRTEMLRRSLTPERSSKLESKGFARAGRRRHVLGA